MRKLIIISLVLLAMFWTGISHSAEEIQQGQPAPFTGSIITDEELAKIIYDIQRLPIVDAEKENLLQQVANLTDT